MAVGIALPIFALGASALGMSAEWGTHGPLVKGLLALSGGVGSNALFDWLKARWFTGPPGKDRLLENHHLAGLVGVALQRTIELAAAEAELADPQKRGIALHAPRLRSIAAAAGDRWLAIVDDESTPQFDPLRAGALTDVVTGVCEQGGGVPILEIEDWEPVVRGVDRLEGSPTLSGAAVTHTARVLRERIGRIFYELLKDARESNPEAYAALQLHFFADLKTASASHDAQLRAIREQLDALGAALEDGAARTTSARGRSFNWQRLTSMLRPMRDMAAEWEKFYARNDQRWDALNAKLERIADDTAETVWMRLLPHMRRAWVAIPAGLLLIAGIAWGVYKMSNQLDASADREAEAIARLAELQRRLDELLPVAEAIRAQNSREAKASPGGAAQTSGALAEAAALRRQSPEELRRQLAETAALAAAAAKAGSGSREAERDYWRKAGELALAANAAADAEKYFRSALALTPAGTVLWCEIAEGLESAVMNQSRVRDSEALLRDIAVHRRALGEPAPTVNALAMHMRTLSLLGRFGEVQALAQEIAGMEPRLAESPTGRNLDAMIEVLLAHVALGDPNAIARVAAIMSRIPAAAPENDRFMRAIAGLATGASALFYDEPARALDGIEAALAVPLESPLLRATLQGTAIESLLSRHPQPPRPPRVDALVRRIAADLDIIVESDFASCGAMYFKKTALLRADGRFDDELALIRHAIQLAEKAHPAGHPHIAIWQCELARALNLPEEFPDAEKLWREALVNIEAAWGADGSTLLSLKSDFAMFLDYHRRHAEALTVQRDVLARLERVLGPDAPRVIHAKFDMLPLLHAMQADAELTRLRMEIFARLRDHAHPEVREVAELFKRYAREPLSVPEFAEFRGVVARIVERLDAKPRHNLNTLVLPSLLIELQTGAGDYAGAFDTARRIVRIGGAIYGSDSLQTAQLLQSQANIHARSRDPAGAEAPLREALRICEERAGRASVPVAHTLVELARLLVDLRRRPEAIAALQRAIGILDGRPDDDPLLRYDAMARLGGLLADAGETAEGERLLRRSIEEQEKKTGFDPYSMEMRVVWLARLLAATNRADEAERALLRAISLSFKNEDGTQALRIGDGFLSYAELLLSQGRGREVEPRFVRALGGRDGPYTRDLLHLYSKCLADLGLTLQAAQERIARVRRGEPVPPL